MNKIYCQIGMLGVLLAFALPAFSQSNVACPVESPYGDQTFEQKFGSEVTAGLRCNEKRSKVRMVMQVNAYAQAGKPYGFRNLENIIKDFEMTHGIDDWKIAIVIHSGGGNLVLRDDIALPDGTYNTFADTVEKYAGDEYPNVDVYFCLNTAAAKGWTADMILPGVKFVPAGLSAIIDFQYQGYKYIQP